MAHRQIAKLKSDNLSSIAYEYNGVVLDGIKVFRVKLSNAKIIPAALNQKFSTMANNESPWAHRHLKLWQRQTQLRSVRRTTLVLWNILCR